MNYVQLNQNKQPQTKLEPQYYSKTYNQWDNAGIIIGNDMIVLDFDNDNINEDKIIKYIEKSYPTLTITTNRGKHFYYKMPKNYKFNRAIKTISTLGFQCDYLTGVKAFAMIKQNGKDRLRNQELNFDNLPYLPEIFYPLKKVKDKKLSGMIEGDARNDNLFFHLLCVKETYPNINLEVLSNIINNIIFEEKLPKQELNNLVKSVSQKVVKEYKNNDKFNEINYSNAKELQQMNLPPITFFVDNLISQGLTIISSLPKIGKSFMSLDLCISISKGLPFLGFNTKQSACFYLALEDSPNRLQDRLNKVLNGEEAPSNLLYTTKCDDLDNGLIKQLEDIRKKEPHVKVFVIDTLQKIRGSYKGNNNYANDYKEISLLKEFADTYGLSVILIHHLKKGNENDVFGKISGTNGITGSADTMITLLKENRADENTIMSIVGRDIEYNEYIIKFNKALFKWEMISPYEKHKEELEKEEYNNNPLVNTIKTLVKEANGNWSGTLKEIELRQKELYPYILEIDKKVTNKKVEKISKLLKKYDDIKYYSVPYPKKRKKRKKFLYIEICIKCR